VKKKLLLVRQFFTPEQYFRDLADDLDGDLVRRGIRKLGQTSLRRQAYGARGHGGKK